MMNAETRISTTTWISIMLVVLMLGGLAVWMYDQSGDRHRLYDQQATHWSAIEQLFRERTEGLLEVRTIIKKEAPYETSIINELAYAQVMMNGVQSRRMHIEAYNETELMRVSLPVFIYNIERLDAHPTLGGLVERLNVLTTRIDKNRFDYNQAVRAYNSRLLTLPSSLAVRMFQIEPLPLFRLRGE